MRFKDIETNEILTREQLEQEYKELRKEGGTEAENFEVYLDNCLVRHNGTLEIIE